jgi:hypothetical protein
MSITAQTQQDFIVMEHLAKVLKEYTLGDIKSIEQTLGGFVVRYGMPKCKFRRPENFILKRVNYQLHSAHEITYILSGTVDGSHFDEDIRKTIRNGCMDFHGKNVFVELQIPVPLHPRDTIEFLMD